MTEKLPVWSTTKSILAYCWQERRLALTYAALPMAILVILYIGAILIGIDGNRFWSFAISIAALVVYAPFTVTWYQSIFVGADEARTRSLFVFSDLEGSVIAANLKIYATVIIAFIPLLIVVVGVGIAFAVMNITSGPFIAVIIGIPTIFAVVLMTTRLSITIAYAAAGERLGLREAWKLTRPQWLPMTWTNIILGTLNMVPFGLIAGTIYLCTRAAPRPEWAEIALKINQIIAGAIYLALSTTLYAFVYRLLKADQAERVSLENAQEA